MKSRTASPPPPARGKAWPDAGARLALAGLAAALLMLAGCAPASAPAPPPTVGVSNPKSLVTIEIPPTPDIPQEQASPAPPLPTPPPAGQPSPTPTVYIGVFLGAIPPEEVEGVVATIGVPPPAAPQAAQLLGPGTCAIALAPPFTNAWGANPLLQERLRCPTNAGFGLRMVGQPFERGVMFWRETGDLYAISEQGTRQGSATDTFWHIIDTWSEGQPESDPAFSPPEGLIQPIRGFGNAWRNTPALREALGWATGTEGWFDSFWQDFEGGWMMVGTGGQVYALVPTDASTGYHFGALPGG